MLCGRSIVSFFYTSPFYLLASLFNIVNDNIYIYIFIFPLFEYFYIDIYKYLFSCGIYSLYHVCDLLIVPLIILPNEYGFGIK